MRALFERASSNEASGTCCFFAWSSRRRACSSRFDRSSTAFCFGGSTTDCWDYSGPGGGGSGGSLYLSADQLTLGTALVNAVAGAAGLGGASNGGAGGVGRIAVRYATGVTGTSTPAADVAVGQ